MGQGDIAGYKGGTVYSDIFRKNAAWVILTMAVLIRLINVNMPILEGTAMRQVQTAMVARNFFRYGIDLLYPMVDHFGNKPGYLVLEFPFIGLLSALAYYILGGIYDVVGRLWSIFFFTGSAVFFFYLVKKLFGRSTAVLSLLVYCFSPLSIIFSRTFMPDFVMLFFVIGSLFFFTTYCSENRLSFFWLSAFFTSLALLAKPHSFYMFIPLIYLVFRKQRLGALTNYRNYLYVLISVVLPLLWYLHARSVVNMMVPEQAYNFDLANWFDPRVFFDKRMYFELMNIYAGIFLTPPGVTLLIFGFFVRTKGDENLIWAWLAGGLVFMIGFVTHLRDPYYNLTMLPIASIFIGRALVFLKGLDYSKTILNSFLGKAVCFLMVILFVARYAGYAYVVPEGYKYVVEAGNAVKEISEKQELIVVSAAGGAQGLYFCDRKGWPLALPGGDPVKTGETIEKLEKYRMAGATLYVGSVFLDFNESVFFKEYMNENYKVIKYVKDKYVIFDIR